MNNKEVWKDVKGYEGLYQVSDFGNVRSLDRISNNRSICGRRLKQINDKNGYKKVMLFKKGSHIYIGVHRLVAKTFLLNPHNYPQVNHKDENKSNNCVNNLEWCSSRYNSNYGTRNRRISQAMYNGKNSMKVVQLNKEGKPIKVWESVHQIERETGYRHTDICACCNSHKSNHTYKTYFWIYYSDYVKMNSKDIKNYIEFRNKRHYHNNTANSKKVVQLDNNKIVHVWSSIKEAARNGFSCPHVSQCCNGLRKHTGGYSWEFYDKYIKSNK